MQRKILITTALPYANGYIHLGHLVEYLQADFWTRFQKMRGHDIAFICGDDTHGTPIMMRARELGITPEKLIADSWQEHFRDFKDFMVEFSHYSSTHSEENRKLCEEFYSHMKKHIHRKDIQQLYCEHDKIFLPDRFVKGTCPKCGATDQYGDSCDVCGATYSPEDLKNPGCSLCGTPPVKKNSEHLLFRLNNFKAFLQEWLPQHTSPEITRKMLEWFDGDLRDWDISRDGPYFGFQIPGESNKYFYVWVDAPMGYVSATQQWCQAQGRNFSDYWRPDEKGESKVELYHFIGKDITYFHTLFWPALLKCAGFNTPTNVFVHGRLMINGEKMSKSKGTMVPARTYLNHLDPSYLRYYYFTKLNSTLDDFDLNMEDFTNRVNSDLVGKITNLGSRSAQMLKKKFHGQMVDPDKDGAEVLQMAQSKSEEIAQHYENRDFVKAANVIREIADLANKYFDEKSPWKKVDTEPLLTQQVLSTALYVFRVLTVYLKPILPLYAAKVEKFFGEMPYTWQESKTLPYSSMIQDYQHLITRVESDKIKAMMMESKKISEEISKQRTQSQTASPTTAAAVPTTGAGGTSHIEMDDFMKVDLRIAKIIEAEEVKEADKLLKLKVDIGGETRQIFAGIKLAYKPESLVGRLTVIVANLKPRKMKFGMSEGMVLAAGEGGSDLYILSPDSGAKPGQRVK